MGLEASRQSAFDRNTDPRATNGSRSFTADYNKRADGSYGDTLHVTDNHSGQSWDYQESNGKFENVSVRVSDSQARWLKSQGVPFNPDGSVDSYLISQSTARLDNQEVTVFNVGGKRMAQRPDGTQLVDRGDRLGFLPVGMPEATARYLKSKGISPSSVTYDTQNNILNGVRVPTIVAGDLKIVLPKKGERLVSYKGSDYIPEPKGHYKLMSTSLTLKQGEPPEPGLLVLGENGTRRFIPKNPGVPVMVDAVVDGKTVLVNQEQADFAKQAQAQLIRMDENQKLADFDQQYATNGYVKFADDLHQTTADLKQGIAYSVSSPGHFVDFAAEAYASATQDYPKALPTGIAHGVESLRSRFATVKYNQPAETADLNQWLDKAGIRNGGARAVAALESGVTDRVSIFMPTAPNSLTLNRTLYGQSEDIRNMFDSVNPEEKRRRNASSIYNAYATGLSAVVPGAGGSLLNTGFTVASMAASPDPMVNNPALMAKTLLEGEIIGRIASSAKGLPSLAAGAFKPGAMTMPQLAHAVEQGQLTPRQMAHSELPVEIQRQLPKEAQVYQLTATAQGRTQGINPEKPILVVMAPKEPAAKATAAPEMPPSPAAQPGSDKSYRTDLPNPSLDKTAVKVAKPEVSTPTTRMGPPSIVDTGQINLSGTNPDLFNLPPDVVAKAQASMAQNPVRSSLSPDEVTAAKEVNLQSAQKPQQGGKMSPEEKAEKMAIAEDVMRVYGNDDPEHQYTPQEVQRLERIMTERYESDQKIKDDQEKWNREQESYNQQQRASETGGTSSSLSKDILQRAVERLPDLEQERAESLGGGNTPELRIKPENRVSRSPNELETFSQTIDSSHGGMIPQFKNKGDRKKMLDFIRQELGEGEIVQLNNNRGSGAIVFGIKDRRGRISERVVKVSNREQLTTNGDGLATTYKQVKDSSSGMYLVVNERVEVKKTLTPKEQKQVAETLRRKHGIEVDFGEISAENVGVTSDGKLVILDKDLQFFSRVSEQNQQTQTSTSTSSSAKLSDNTPTITVKKSLGRSVQVPANAQIHKSMGDQYVVVDGQRINLDREEIQAFEAAKKQPGTNSRAQQNTPAPENDESPGGGGFFSGLGKFLGFDDNNSSKPTESAGGSNDEDSGSSSSDGTYHKGQGLSSGYTEYTGDDGKKHRDYDNGYKEVEGGFFGWKKDE